MNRTSILKTGFLLCAAFSSALTGCIGYVDRPHSYANSYPQPPPVYVEPHDRVYVQPAPVYVEPTVVLQEDYVYYPSYQVYYSGRTREYVYLEGHNWVSRAAPPRVSASVLFASPSIRLGFHDHPSNHHDKISRQYPRNWAPPGQQHGRKQGHGDRD